MNRRTTNPTDAMHRLAGHLGLPLEPVGAKQYRVTINNTTRTGTAKRVLAWLIEVAQFKTGSGGAGMTREEVRDLIRLDTIDDHGLKSHEYAEIRLVTLAVSEGRR